MSYRPKRNVDAVFCERASAMSERYIKNCERVVNDEGKAERLKLAECRRCFYGSRFGGAAMTETKCGLCEKEMIFSSTNTDVICESCAGENKLCKHCGGDIESNPRRRKWIKKQA